MKQTFGQVLSKHVQAHASLYLFITVLFIMGVIFGTLTVQSLGYEQRSDLFYYVQQFMTELQQDHFVDSSYAFIQNFMHHLKFIGFMWILGLSVIGLPLILIMLFLKGVFIGFSVGFLVHQMGWQGFWLSFVAVIPQNMVIVPLIFVMSVLSITFSLKIIGHLLGSRPWMYKISISKYVGSLVPMAVMLVFVALFKTYISPLLMNAII